VRKLDCRYLVDAQQPCRSDPSMTGNDLALVVDQNRVTESEALDAVCDLTDLSLAMRPRVAHVGAK
jgi:hypothetical protein